MSATPYYADAAVTLYHGDCREVLPTLPAGSVDLIVTDPPYGQWWRSNARRDQLDRIVGDDDQAGALLREALVPSLRALKDKRHLYIFGRPDLSGRPVGPTAELVWDKVIIGLGDLSSAWGPSHEPITFAAYVPRLRRGSVLRVPRANAGALEARHDPRPAGKPVHLLRQLIESSSLLGETVLDPFAGGGATLLAARVEGRKAIGVESEERYCESAARRLASGTWAVAG